MSHSTNANEGQNPKRPKEVPGEKFAVAGQLRSRVEGTVSAVTLTIEVFALPKE